MLLQVLLVSAGGKDYEGYCEATWQEEKGESDQSCRVGLTQAVTLSTMSQDEAEKLEQAMNDRHAEEVAALEQRERDAAGPQDEKTSILNTDLYSFSLPPAETQKNVRVPS